MTWSRTAGACVQHMGALSTQRPRQDLKQVRSEDGGRGDNHVPTSECGMGGQPVSTEGQQLGEAEDVQLEAEGALGPTRRKHIPRGGNSWGRQGRVKEAVERAQQGPQ